MPEAAEHELQKMVDEIVGYRKRTRWLRWGTAALAVVSMVLGITVAILFAGQDSQTATLRQQTTALHQDQLANCANANGIRSRERALWNTLFELSAPANTGQPPPSAKVAALQREFLHDVDVTFATVNCAKAFPEG